MPIISSADLTTRPANYTLLVLGSKRSGKSTMCIATAPGPVLVVVFEADDSLYGPKKMIRDLRAQGVEREDFEILRVTPPKANNSAGTWNEMLRAQVEIRAVVERGDYRTVIYDSISVLGKALEREITALPAYHTGGDIDKPLIIQSAYGDIARKSDHLFSQIALLSQWAHVIVTNHYTQHEKELDGQTPKYGEGIMPLWPGQFREQIGLHLTNVVWMDMKGEKDVKEGRATPDVLEFPYNGRVFVTGNRGGWGPGCRNWAGNYVVPADVSKLFERFDAEMKDVDDSESEEEEAPASAPTPKKIAAPPPKPAARPAAVTSPPKAPPPPKPMSNIPNRTNTNPPNRTNAPQPQARTSTSTQVRR